MSKSILHRIEKVALEALSELREQIAKEIELLPRWDVG